VEPSGANWWGLAFLILALVALVVLSYLVIRYRAYAAALATLGVAGALTLAGHGISRLGDGAPANDAVGTALLSVATFSLLLAAGIIHWMQSGGEE